MPFRLLVLVGLICVMSSSCVRGRKPEAPSPTVVPSDLYQAPKTYEDHRAQQQVINSSGRKIAYTDHGTGPALVLLHGVPTSSWMYRKMIPELQKDFRVITIDFLGYGSSDKPKSTGTNYSTEQQARYVLDVLRRLRVNRYNLLFHDMGGLVGWRLLRLDKNGNKRISGLVVLNTIISKKGFDHPNLKEGKLSEIVTRAYASKLSSRAVLGMTFRSMGLTKTVKLTEEECRGYVQPMREGSNEALYHFFTGLNDERFARLDQDLQATSGFRGNALVVWGARDKILTVEQLPQLYEHLNIPQGNIKILRQNSHFLAEEIPDELSGYIKKALR